MLSPSTPRPKARAPAAGATASGAASVWPRDDPITVTTTIEEDGYAPITVEGAVLSLFLDRLEVCVPQTKFTISIYLRDVFRLAPWGDASSDGQSALAFHTGVFAPRRYIVRASGRSSSTSLKMLYDLLRMKIVPRDPPSFPTARSLVHEELARRYFGPRDDAVSGQHSVPPPTHLEWFNRPTMGGDAASVGFDQRHSTAVAAAASRSEFSTPWMMSRSPSVVGGGAGGPHVAAPHQAIHLDDVPASHGGRRKPPPVAEGTTPVGNNYGYAPAFGATPSVGLSRVASGYLETPTASGGDLRRGAGVPYVPRPATVEVSSCGVQTTAVDVAPPTTTPHRAEVIGPPEGPVVAPQPPLWLLQRNLLKMQEQEQLLHKKAPKRRQESYEALLDLANAAYGPPSSSLHRVHLPPPCEVAVERAVYASYLEDCKRNEFQFAADSPPPPPPQRPALSDFMQPPQHAASPPLGDDAQSSRVALAEQRLQAKSSLAALQRKVSTRRREDVMVAIESDASTPSSPRRLAVPIQRAVSISGQTVARGQSSSPTHRPQPTTSNRATVVLQPPVPPPPQHRASMPAATGGVQPVVEGSPLMPAAEGQLEPAAPPPPSPPVPSMTSPPALPADTDGVRSGAAERTSHASNPRPLQKVYTGIQQVVSSVVAPPAAAPSQNAAAPTVSPPSSASSAPLEASVTAWEAFSLEAPAAAVGGSQPMQQRSEAAAAGGEATATSSRSDSRVSAAPVATTEPTAAPPISRPVRQGIPMPHLQAQQSAGSSTAVRRPTLDGAPELLRRVGTVR